MTQPPVLKGLILSGGTGSRMRPFTYSGAKQLLPVANKPVLFYAIEALVAAGITDIGIVTGATGTQIEAATGDGDRFGCRLAYIEQDAPRGLAHAVQTAQPFLGDSPFVVFLGDNFLRGGIAQHVSAFRGSSCDAQLLLKPVSNPSEFGVAVLDSDGRVIRLLEKPAEPPSDLAILGIYMFQPCLFDAIRRISASPRGELEITDAIQALLDDGSDVRASVVRDDWLDTGSAADILHANRIILDDLSAANAGTVERSRITGQVVIEPGARVINSVIEGPAIIGQDTEVRDCRIGPHTSLGQLCYLQEVDVEGSIVMERCRLENPGVRLHESILGRAVELRGDGHRRGSLSLMLGDHSRMELS